MRAAGFVGCLGVEALKLRRTMALALAVLLPAAVVTTFLVFILQKGSTEFSAGVHPEAMIVLGVVGLWAVFVLPIFVAIETSLLAAIEHQNRGWKHLFALPPARGAVLAAKFASAVLLVTIAHAFLSAFTLVLLWAVPKLEPGLGFRGPMPIAATLLVVASCAVSSLFMVGIHTWVSLRWASFALNVGIALGGIFYALGVLDSVQGKYLPWSLPVVAHKVAVPWIFGLPGWPGGPAGPWSLLTLLATSMGGWVVAAVFGGWLLSRRDIF